LLLVELAYAGAKRWLADRQQADLTGAGDGNTCPKMANSHTASRFAVSISRR
jgi:hypothetical protein